MRIFAQLLFILGFPLCAITFNEAMAGSFGDESVWSHLSNILIGTLLVSVPQLIIGLLYLLGVISKPTYLGGLFAGHAWLGTFVILLLLDRSAPGTEDSPWFVYFPVCFVLVLAGTGVGYLLNRFWFSKRRAQIASEKSAHQ